MTFYCHVLFFPTTFPHFRHSLNVKKSEYSHTCRQKICLIRSIDTSNKIKKDVVICHILALDYDIDQLGYRSTATQHNTTNFSKLAIDLLCVFQSLWSGSHPQFKALRLTQCVTKPHRIQTDLYGWFLHPTVCAYSSPLFW